MDTAQKDSVINPYLDRNCYYWIGLGRRGPGGPKIGGGKGNFVWTKSGKKATYSLWWKDFSEPSGNGNCVFKDPYLQDNKRQFGWADYPCSDDSWNRRGIFALCEIQDPTKTKIHMVTFPSDCPHNPGSTCYMQSSVRKNWFTAVQVNFVQMKENKIQRFLL